MNTTSEPTTLYPDPRNTLLNIADANNLNWDTHTQLTILYAFIADQETNMEKFKAYCIRWAENDLSN